MTRKKTNRAVANGTVAVNQERLIRNALIDRGTWIRQMLEQNRDIDHECGHPREISIEDYRRAFDRGDLATRVVKVWPEESWSTSPFVFETEGEIETEFEKAWDGLVKRFQIYAILQRADVLSGIGQFGVVLFGFSDGGSLESEVTGKTELLYLRTFDQSLVKVESLENEITNPRYGLPKLYEVDFSDPVNPQIGAKRKVHWTRILHLADNRTTSDVYGTPRMQMVYNRLLDTKKIVGGSAEMFWKGGFPGLSLEAMTLPDGTQAEIDVEGTKAQIESYQNGLQRYLALVGMQAKSLSPQVANPMPHVDVQTKLIAMALGVPWRVLSGSEAAQLASEQDTRAWNRRLDRRRREYLQPFVVLPFIERLVQFGALPKPQQELMVEWLDLHTLSDTEKAAVAEKKTNAMAKYIQFGCSKLISPFHFLTRIIGMKDKEARTVIDETKESAVVLEPPILPRAQLQRNEEPSPISRNQQETPEGKMAEPFILNIENKGVGKRRVAFKRAADGLLIGAEITEITETEKNGK